MRHFRGPVGALVGGGGLNPRAGGGGRGEVGAAFPRPYPLSLRHHKERPRQDSNLRHRLRRPVLYPLSYGGGVAAVPTHGQGTIVVVLRRTRSRARRLARQLPYPAHPCRRTTTWRPHPWNVISCRVQPSWTRRGTFASAGSISWSWRRSSAPLSSSTTRTTCARPAGKRSPPGARASPTPRRPSCAGPWPGWPTRRACTSTSRPAASSMWRAPPECPRTASSCTATTSRPRSWSTRSPTGSAASSWTPSTRSPVSAACWKPRHRPRRDQGSSSG